MALVGLLLNPIFVSADSFEPPQAFEIYSEDGSRVFRFVPGEEWNDDHFIAVFEVDTDDMVYEVDLYHYSSYATLVYPSQFTFSEDMTYFVQGNLISKEIALLFYAEGQLINRTDISDLIRNMPGLQESETMVHWVYRYGWNFDPETYIPETHNEGSVESL